MPLKIVRWRHSQFAGSGQRSQLGREIVGDRKRTIRAAAVHVFPHDPTIGRHLKESTGVVLGDKRIAIREPTLGPHRFTKKLDVRVAFRFIRPHNLFGNWVEFDDEGLTTMRSLSGKEAIVENDDVAFTG